MIAGSLLLHRSGWFIYCKAKQFRSFRSFRQSAGTVFFGCVWYNPILQPITRRFPMTTNNIRRSCVDCASTGCDRCSFEEAFSAESSAFFFLSAKPGIWIPLSRRSPALYTENEEKQPRYPHVRRGGIRELLQNDPRRRNGRICKENGL